MRDNSQEYYLWDGYGNDGMRFPELCDVLGGETDNASFGLIEGRPYFAGSVLIERETGKKQLLIKMVQVSISGTKMEY